MRSVLRRMRPAVHPDHRLVAIAPAQDFPGEQLLRDWVWHHDELQRERTHDRVDRRVHLTLALGRGEGRDVVAQRLRAAVGAERHAEEIDRFPRGAVVVRTDALPGAGEIDLRGRHDRDCGHRERTREDPAYPAHLALQPEPITISTNTASDPIWCRLVPS